MDAPHHPTKGKMNRTSLLFITSACATFLMALVSLAGSLKLHPYALEAALLYEINTPAEDNNLSRSRLIQPLAERSDYAASSKDHTAVAGNTDNTTLPYFDLLSQRHLIPHDDPQLVSIIRVPQIDKRANPHYFVFPKEPQQQQQHEQQVMCVPQKNGNRQTAGLFYALHKQGQAFPVGHREGEVVQNLSQINAHYPYWPPLSSMGEGEDKDGEMEQDLFVVARNPYTRILSYFLDKIQRKHKNANFTTFVEAVESKTIGPDRKTLCRIDHHLCSQVTVCLRPALAAAADDDNANANNNNNSTTSAVVVQEAALPTIYKLKLEEQATWFPWLLQITNSNTSLLHGEQFVQFSGTPCFYTPTGNCRDMTKIIPPASLLQNKTVQVGRQHPTGASRSEMMNLHYNAYTASVISNLYREDFELFGYPSWDGVSPWIS